MICSLKFLINICYGKTVWLFNDLKVSFTDRYCNGDHNSPCYLACFFQKVSILSSCFETDWGRSTATADSDYLWCGVVDAVQKVLCVRVMQHFHGACRPNTCCGCFIGCAIFVSNMVKRHSISNIMCHWVEQCECGNVYVKQLVKCDSANS